MFRSKKSARWFVVKVFVVVVLVLPMFRSEPVAKAGDWPQFMHDSQHTGDAGDERLEIPLSLVAQIKLDDAVLTSPAVVSGRAYIVDQMGTAYCLDPDARRVLWKSAPEADDAFGSNTSSPCVAKGRVYYGTTGGNLHILDAGTGNLIRSIALGWPIVSAITSANDSIYFQALDAVVHCLDLDGDTRWQWDYYKDEEPAETRHYGGATVTVAGRKVITAIGWDIVCLDDLTTEAKMVWWRRPFGALIPLGTAVSDGHVYSAFPGKDGKGAVIRYSLKDGAFDSSLDMVTDQWSVLGTPAVRGTTAYFGRQAHGVIAHQFGLSPDKGRRWSSFGPEPESLTPSASSPALSDRFCLFTTLGGELVGIDLTAHGGGRDALKTEPFRFKTPYGKVITSSPAIAGGRVFFGCDDGYLYVLGRGEAIEPAKEELTLHKPRSRISPAGKRAYGWPSTFGGPRNASFVDDPGFKPPFKLRWAVHSHGIFKQTMCATSQDVIYGSLAGLVVSREQRTGRIRWRRKLPEQGYCRAGLLCAEGKVYVPRTFNMRYPKVWGQKDAMFCLDGDTGDILWESPIGIGDHLRASPVLVDGVVAFGSRYFPLKHLRPVIPRNASWQYLAGSDPPQNWTSLEFDARQWKTDVGSFGYGDDDIMTHLDMRGKYTRVYVRTTFQGKDLLGAHEVGLMVKYDDAFIAYLNGREILRKGVATGHGAEASDIESRDARGFEYFQITGWQELVKKGINVIALEGHNVNATSTDFSLHPYLVVRTEQAQQGPMVDAWDADTGRRLWQIKINGGGEYLEGPAGCAGGGLMFFTGGGSKAGETLAIVPKTGKVLWRTSKAYASQSGTPSYQDGKVYLPGICRLPMSCLSAADGEIVWQHDVKDSSGLYRYFVDAMSLGPDYFTVNNKYMGGAKRWNLSDGTLAGAPNGWINLFGGSQGCGSVVLTSEGMALSATAKGLHIVEADTGKLLWKSLGMAPRACPSPAVSNGRIFYCPRANGMMYCFEPDNVGGVEGELGSLGSVSLEGAISGVGDPPHMRIRLTRETFGDEVGWCVTSPDGGFDVAKPSGLEAGGTGKGEWRLSYFYCCASSHKQSDHCDNFEHDPLYYKRLRIDGGTLHRDAGKTQIIWPTGSPWRIGSKDTRTATSGKLAAPVIYKQN
ncbi:MAG: outer membrane protein assembly factor BamB family protein [Planctomycetota bacterium]